MQAKPSIRRLYRDSYAVRETSNRSKVFLQNNGIVNQQEETIPMKQTRRFSLSCFKLLWMALLCCVSLPALAQNTDKPNILVIWGDDIGVHNISAYNRGLMGYQTPNIDRIGTEGAVFTDAYGQQSCTAGRASFALGEHPFRTGLLTIGMPGSPHGIPEWAPTIGDLLKEQGYTTGQFGKNHLGDLDEPLPTNDTVEIEVEQ
jgi:hypothetical protein